MKKTLNVVAAAIYQKSPEGEVTVFTGQRGYGKYKGLYEWPGGKVEDKDASLVNAIRREIFEELGGEIAVDRTLSEITYEYEDFYLHMTLFWCHLIGESKLTLLEHTDGRWLNESELESIHVQFAPADEALLPIVRQAIKEEANA